MATVLSPLYWSLPGPRDFIRRVEVRSRACQATVLSFPKYLVPGTWDGVKEGLQRADVRQVFDVTIGEGTDIAYEVGPCVGLEFATPATLAELNTGEPTAVLLRAASDGARQNCEDYFYRFLLALEYVKGNVHLFIEMRDGERRFDSYANDVQVLTFDGSLSADEMAAYVGIRMLGREGPGTTKLLRSLVTEYAGYDAGLAERLIAFSDSDILGLPDSLAAILEEQPLRWRTESWTEGTQSALDGGKSRHPLHEWYLALHRGPHQAEALAVAKRRYWRACVRALTPWLEERRGRVLNMLKKPLDDVRVAQGGKLLKPVGRGKVIPVDPSEIEFNNVVGMYFKKILDVPSDNLSQQALSVCFAAKTVRDDLAHSRPPRKQDVVDLVTKMDALFQD